MSNKMNPDCKCYVGDLGNHASQEELEDAFSRYGRVRKVWVARNPPGFAFVEMEDPRDAEDATRSLDGRRVCGRRVRVEMATGRQRGGRSRIADEKCYECGKYGHFARDCLHRRRGGPRRRSGSYDRPSRYRRSRSRSRRRSESRSPTRSRTRSRSRDRSASRTKEEHNGSVEKTTRRTSARRSEERRSADRTPDRRSPTRSRSRSPSRPDDERD